MIHPFYLSSYDLLKGFLHMLSCKQAQHVAHGNCRPMQPQFPPQQDLSDWQPQQTSLRTCSGAYGVPDDMFLGIRDLFRWSASQPKAIGSIAGDSPVRAARFEQLGGELGANSPQRPLRLVVDCTILEQTKICQFSVPTLTVYTLLSMSMR